MIYTFVIMGLLFAGIKFVQILQAFEGDWGTKQWIMAASIPVMAIVGIILFIKVYKDSKVTKAENEQRFEEMQREEKQRKRELYFGDFESPAEAIETNLAEPAGASDAAALTGEESADGEALTLSEGAEGGEEPIIDAETAAETAAEKAAPYSKFDE